MAFRIHSKNTMNGSSQRRFRKLYSSPKLVVKMKLNNLFTAQIIIPINARRGRAVKLKFIRYQLVVDVLIKRNFVSHMNKLWQSQDNYVRYLDFHKVTSSRKNNAKSQYFMTIKHPNQGSWMELVRSFQICSE